MAENRCKREPVTSSPTCSVCVHTRLTGIAVSFSTNIGRTAIMYAKRKSELEGCGTGLPDY